ncbi:integrase core domain-containing protein [Crateriforma conspicua]|uniref:integrase core domain-containing protein n=1 Tax=Crateriforma conspicua TaxID=2527996 RepID=UPI00118946A9|nr:integrase core domain-containing protein [Crateriforma conspicua]QDV62527.1 Integrase core domain protein [Crateriforma conspicua]
MPNQSPFIFQPWLFVLWCMAGWIGKQQQEVIDYLVTENAILREKVGGKRILLDDDQRRRLAVKGKVLGRKRLRQIKTLFTPDTLLRWHRRLVAEKHTYPGSGKSGRPKISVDTEALIVRLANENSTWGCDRIQGELRKLSVIVSDTTVQNVLKSNGIEPQPTRKDGTSWSEFLAAHLDCLGAIDFTTVDVWTPKGLRTIYLLFAMQIGTRKVQCLGSTEHPDEAWMLEAVDRVTADDGIFGGENHPTIVLMDRDTKFSKAFRAKLENKEVKPHVLPPRSPNLNAHMERFIGTYKRELARQMIFFGKSMLDKATAIFLEHYHDERPHQGLDNERIMKFEHPPPDKGEIVVDKRLGGLLKSYSRAA